MTFRGSNCFQNLSITLRFLLTALGLGLSAAGAEEVWFAFDDDALPWRDNLQLTLVAGQKHPANPVLRCGPEGSPDYGHALLYGSVLHEGGKFRMWYLGMIEKPIGSDRVPGWWRPMCYAESKDGVHWTKPELGLVEFNGNRKNNICLIESDPPSLSRVNDYLTVLHDPSATVSAASRCTRPTPPATASAVPSRGRKIALGPTRNESESFSVPGGRGGVPCLRRAPRVAQSIPPEIGFYVPGRTAMGCDRG